MEEEELASIPKRCPECGSTKLIKDYEHAEIVCGNCGIVIKTNLEDRGPEWRAFDDEQKAKRTRVGAPLTYTIHDKGLTTIIDWHDKDVSGKKLKPDQKAQIYRLRKWHRRIRIFDAQERNLAHALSELSKIAEALNTPRSVLETAAVVYRRAIKHGLIRGRSIRGMAAAAIYIACRKCMFTRTLDEVAEASGLSKKEVGRSYRFLVKELDFYVPPSTPSQYASRLVAQLAMQGEAEKIAQKTLVMASQLRLTGGRGPTGMAAAATYIASVLTGERKTQREIAELARVTEVTIRNRYKSLIENLMFIIYL